VIICEPDKKNKGQVMGKQKWELENLIHRIEIVETEELRKMIEETVEIIYSDFCQLQEDSSICATNNENKTLEEAA
jgi:hypothetical protein